MIRSPIAQLDGSGEKTVHGHPGSAPVVDRANRTPVVRRSLGGDTVEGVDR
jgi:hypothetical protein